MNEQESSSEEEGEGLQALQHAAFRKTLQQAAQAAAADTSEADSEEAEEGASGRLSCCSVSPAHAVPRGCSIPGNHNGISRGALEKVLSKPAASGSCC